MGYDRTLSQASPDGQSQGELFRDIPTICSSARRIARRSDPPTSHLAAAQVTKSGRRESLNQKILTFLQGGDEGLTYREIGAGLGEDHTETMRRLNDLRRAGLVEKVGRRTCRINGNEMTTWAVKRA